MNYKYKHLIDDSAPDGLDLDGCPVYQEYLKSACEDAIKQKVKQILESRDEPIF